MEFEMRKKGKFERAEEFTKRIKEVYKKAEAVLRKYINRKRNKPEEYRVDNQVLLNTKDLKFQIKGRCLEKLIEQFVGLYKMKRIILTNVIELELLSTVKNTSSSKHQQSTYV